jgi:NAD(P)-dependent dehydrogenase (short-subunit alcohol dehydrogenase family)
MSSTRYPDLEGKAVIVTGGGAGIGAAIVRGFAAQGARVGFIDRDEAAARAIAAETGAVPRVLDLTDIAALREGMAGLRAALGPVSVLVNNAAHDERHRIEDVTPEYWDGRVAVNLRHQFFAAQALLGDLRATQGAIVNLGSKSWRSMTGGMPVYLACKAAIEGLTAALARDLGADGVRVNCVVPGWVETQRQRALWLTAEGERENLARQCLKRMLQPEDISRVVLFLASGDASGMTGQAVMVDGGRA